MTNPWLIPLTISSATVMGLRTWLLWPVGGRHTDWQRREAARMVGEKIEAIQESQSEALALAWRLWFMPWTVWGPLSGRSLQGSMNSATHAMVHPFSRRAAGNAARLQSHAVRTAARAQPAMAAALPALTLVGAPVRRASTRSAPTARRRPRRKPR